MGDASEFICNDGSSHHITKVVKKTKWVAGWVLRYAPREPEVMLTLCMSLVQPTLDYCNQLYSPIKKTNIQMLEAVQWSYTRQIRGLWPQLLGMTSAPRTVPRAEIPRQVLCHLYMEKSWKNWPQNQNPLHCSHIPVRWQNASVAEELSQHELQGGTKHNCLLASLIKSQIFFIASQRAWGASWAASWPSSNVNWLNY